jgi:uncharacterized protein YdeI (BOF family)
MKKQLCSLLSVGTFALAMGATALAQEDKKVPTDPNQNTPTQSTPSTQAPAPTDNSAATSTPTGTSQTFTGTVVKSGDKFVLQDASGMSYDVDKQDALKPFEGKKVNIKGTLDSSSKMIHVQQ